MGLNGVRLSSVSSSWRMDGERESATNLWILGVFPEILVFTTFLTPKNCCCSVFTTFFSPPPPPRTQFVGKSAQFSAKNYDVNNNIAPEIFILFFGATTTKKKRRWRKVNEFNPPRRKDEATMRGGDGDGEDGDDKGVDMKEKEVLFPPRMVWNWPPDPMRSSVGIVGSWFCW